MSDAQGLDVVPQADHLGAMWRPDEVTALFAHGPVLALAHADHPAHRGVPPHLTGTVLVMQLSGARSRAQIETGAASLTVLYDGAEDARCEATIALDGVFLLAARDREGTAHVLAHPPLPPVLAELESIQVPRLLAELGLMPARPVWVLPSDEAQLAAAHDGSEPDKEAALSRLRERSGQVWLLLNTAARGLRLAHEIGDQTEHALLLAAETEALAIDRTGVHWQQDGAMHVPWSAVAAMQGADDLRGWFWPADLPPRLHDDYRQGPLWPMVCDLEGVALRDLPSLPPVEVLTPPSDFRPDEAVAHCLDQGAGMVVIDASEAAVPAGLESQLMVVVPIGLPGLAVSITCDPTGFTAQMPDACGEPGQLRAAWSSVLAVSSFGGALHGAWSWPEHAGPAVLAHGGRDEELILAVEQPCGHVDAQGQPTLHVEVRLPLRVVH